MSPELKAGDRVRCERSFAPMRGTWPLYSGRTGTVLRFADGEVAVRLDDTGATTHFLPCELKLHRTPLEAQSATSLTPGSA